jgi:hypothetical protein
VIAIVIEDRRGRTVLSFFYLGMTMISSIPVAALMARIMVPND